VTTAKNQEEVTGNQPARASNNIFEDPAIREAATNDAFARFVITNWRSVLALLVAVGVVMVAYTSYTTTALNKRAAATARLAEIQESYKALLDTQDDLSKTQSELANAKDDAQKATLTTSVEQKTKSLAESQAKLTLVIDSLDTTPPFDTLAQLYRGLVAGRFKDFEGVTKALAAIPAWSTLPNGDSSKRFVAETAALGLAKSLAQSEQHQQQAADQLRALAEGGAYVAVEALGAYSALAKTPDQIASTRTLIDSVKARFPAQERYLAEINERLSIQRPG